MPFEQARNKARLRFEQFCSSNCHSIKKNHHRMGSALKPPATQCAGDPPPLRGLPAPELRSPPPPPGTLFETTTLRSPQTLAWKYCSKRLFSLLFPFSSGTLRGLLPVGNAFKEKNVVTVLPLCSWRTTTSSPPNSLHVHRSFVVMGKREWLFAPAQKSQGGSAESAELSAGEAGERREWGLLSARRNPILCRGKGTCVI